MDAAEAVAQGDLSVRVPVYGRGEFGRLAASFNHMVEELALADQRRRNLTADVAHELRTPLHIIQGNLEGVLDGVYTPTREHIGATLEETKLLARLVEDLRVLSQAESGQLPMAWEPVDMTELLTDVATSFSGQAQAAGVTLLTDIGGATVTDDRASDEWVIRGDYGRLDQVLGNLGSTVLSVMKIIGFQNSAAVTDTWIHAYSAHFTSPEECKGAIEFPLEAYSGRAVPFALECALKGQEETRKKPAMLVRGMKDYAIPRELMVGAFRGLWPKGPIIELENAGHFSQEDAPEIIVPLIQQFIQMTD
jgi:hypothetical protein